MKFPTIHKNGSDPESLKVPLIDAINNLHDAIRTLDENGPNARDYYVQEEGAESYLQAVREHTARVKKLTEVRADLIALVEHIG
jgi:hypothetical protein